MLGFRKHAFSCKDNDLDIKKISEEIVLGVVFSYFAFCIGVPLLLSIHDSVGMIVMIYVVAIPLHIKFYYDRFIKKMKNQHLLTFERCISITILFIIVYIISLLIVTLCKTTKIDDDVVKSLLRTIKLMPRYFFLSYVIILIYIWKKCKEENW